MIYEHIIRDFEVCRSGVVLIKGNYETVLPDNIFHGKLFHRIGNIIKEGSYDKFVFATHELASKFMREVIAFI